jgi:hypothetical protein
MVMERVDQTDLSSTFHGSSSSSIVSSSIANAMGRVVSMWYNAVLRVPYRTYTDGQLPSITYS